MRSAVDLSTKEIFAEAIHAVQCVMRSDEPSVMLMYSLPGQKQHGLYASPINGDEVAMLQWLARQIEELIDRYQPPEEPHGNNTTR